VFLGEERNILGSEENKYSFTVKRNEQTSSGRRNNEAESEELNEKRENDKLFDRSADKSAAEKIPSIIGSPVFGY